MTLRILSGKKISHAQNRPAHRRIVLPIKSIKYVGHLQMADVTNYNFTHNFLTNLLKNSLLHSSFVFLLPPDKRHRHREPVARGRQEADRKVKGQTKDGGPERRESHASKRSRPG